MNNMISSLNLTTQTAIEREQLQKLKKIWQSLFDSVDSTEFRVRVDWEAYGLLDYPDLIKNPMDLGTVNTKLTSGQYLYIEQVMDDIQLIWDNCKTYNLAGSWIYNLADKLQKNYKKMLKNYLPTIPFSAAPGKAPTTNQVLPKSKGGNNNKKKQKSAQIYNQDQQERISYQQKINFSQKLKFLSPESLGQVIEKIIQSCPTAFSDIDGQKVQILLENIDLIAFRQINAFVDQIAHQQSYGIKKIKIN